MAATRAPASTNRLLAALEPGALERLLPKLTRVELTQRQPIYAPDAPIQNVYFIEVGMVSLVANLANGMQAEVGLVGREGMTGISVISNVARSFVEAMVQMPGRALRMGVEAFRQEIQKNAPLRILLHRYNEALHVQVSQTAACNGRHDLQQRLARWLLMARDRQDDDKLPLTQEFMAMMLGVHRPSLTLAAGMLQQAGLIRYRSGRVTVIDRPGLEAASCECYSVVRRRVAVLLDTDPQLDDA